MSLGGNLSEESVGRMTFERHKDRGKWSKRVDTSMGLLVSYCQMLCLSGLRWRRLWVVGV
jgi:hypothetical protein